MPQGDLARPLPRAGDAHSVLGEIAKVCCTVGYVPVFFRLYVNKQKTTTLKEIVQNLTRFTQASL